MAADVLYPPLDVMTPPTPPFASSDRPISRPLSEISDNSDRRRSTPRSLKGEKGEKTSRPNSEVREIDPPKRLSASLPLQTISVNLVDYASVVAKGPASAVSNVNTAPPPPSPTTKPTVKLERPGGMASRPVSTGSTEEEVGKEGEAGKESGTKDDEAR